MEKQKIGILSLGCPRNLVDSEALLGRLSRMGYEISDINSASVGIVNTCAFIEEAKKESIEAILDMIELKKEGRLKKIIVAGCLSQRYKGPLTAHFKEVDAFIGRIDGAGEIKDSYGLTPKHYAYVKISEGCMHSCSYCVIPKIKGALKSRDMSSILRQIENLDSQGKSEINLVAQDLSSYGFDLSRKLLLDKLLKRITEKIKNIHWVRLLYLHPENISDNLISLIANEPKICKYVDLPVQHINARILKKMNRKTKRAQIESIIHKLRRAVKPVALRTSLIVGFPGETDKEFEELCDFVKEAKFERLGVFKYSREEGTPAYNYPAQVSEKVKAGRFNAIMRLQQEISEGINKSFLGRVIEVLIDEPRKEAAYLGRTMFDAPEVDGSVYVKTKKLLKPGQFCKVKITDTLEYDLTGEVTNF